MEEFPPWKYYVQNAYFGAIRVASLQSNGNLGRLIIPRENFRNKCVVYKVR